MSLLDMRIAVLDEGEVISLVTWVGGNELDTLLDVLRKGVSWVLSANS